MRAVAFVDAANLFYGGEKSLGWKIDFLKLLGYLREKYGVGPVRYFASVDLVGFSHDPIKEDTVSLAALETFLANRSGNPNAARSLGQVRFYRKLESFGYDLHLKPLKRYPRPDGGYDTKGNCDVDMALSMVEELPSLDRAVVLSGDGDFLPVLKRLREAGKEVVVLARHQRTAREIRVFAGAKFSDFEYLRELLRQPKK